MNEERQKRSVACGVGQMLTLTVVLIAILIGLSIWGLVAQQEVMSQPYTLKNADQVPTLGAKAGEYMSLATQAEANNTDTNTSTKEAQ